MTSLRDQFEDPAEAVVEGLYELGFDDTDILGGVPDLEPDPADFDSPVEYLRDHEHTVYGPFDESSEERKWERATGLFDVAIPSGFALDWKWHAHKVASQASRGLELFGHEMTTRIPTSDRNYLEPKSKHPPVFYVELYEKDDEKIRDEVVIRLPPSKSERSAILNHEAVAEALNRTLLDDLGLELVWRCALPGDRAPFAILEKDRLNELQSTYGEGVSLFGKEVFERGLLERALEGYAPENAVDHEAEFGVPEPAETFKVEELPEASKIVE